MGVARGRARAAATAKPRRNASHSQPLYKKKKTRPLLGIALHPANYRRLRFAFLPSPQHLPRPRDDALRAGRRTPDRTEVSQDGLLLGSPRTPPDALRMVARAGDTPRRPARALGTLRLPEHACGNRSCACRQPKVQQRRRRRRSSSTASPRPRSRAPPRRRAHRPEGHRRRHSRLPRPPRRPGRSP